MDLHSSLRVPANSLFLAEQIANLRQPLPDLVIKEAFREAFRVSTQTTFVPGDDVSSACCWVNYGDTVVLLCDGIATAGQGAGTWNGYVGGLLSSITQPVNDYFASASGKIRSALPLGYLSATRNFVFAGWSLGGCEAMQCALDGADIGNWPMPRIATFGSPRFGNAALARRFGTSNMVRWMTDTDPVPILPPRVTDMPILPAIYGIQSTLRMGNFVHVTGGVSINPTGVISEAETPPLAPAAFPLTLASWLAGADAASGSPHWIGTYATRLRLWIADHPENLSPVRVYAPIEPTGQSTRGHTAREQAAQEAMIFDQASAQEAVHNRIPRELLFHAVRVNRMWYVTFKGDVIAIGPTKKRAQGFAASGNDFLHRSLKEGYVDTDQLANSFRQWLSAAQDTGSGITPTIAGTLP